MKVTLPIDALLPQFAQILAKHSSVILSAAPGAGKTTRVPPAILKLTDKEVWVLEPRRIAAISAAQRIAEENNLSLGKEVGYQVRFENKSSRDTRLLFLTEALLLRKLLQDPELSRVGCVVLDEFHERSLHVDLALGALRELQQLARPDLKIVVMSATLDAQPLSAYLGDAPIVDVPGKIFPLTIRQEEKSQLLQTNFDFIERMRRLIGRALSENSEGDLLCFLPGRGEIERLRNALAENLSDAFAIFTLHGQLNLQEQRQALMPMVGRRKIILATNVAESSLTVEGVRIVVDSGLCRLQQQHPRTGFESLDLVRISKASATQRAGRAARQGPGIVYRAWTPHDEISMGAFEAPEIQRVDLAEALLLLGALGVTPQSFSWFQAPPPRALEQAQKFLQALGALDPQSRLTELGQRLRQFPVHPRLAKLLLIGKQQGIPFFAADLAALLSEAKSSTRNSANSGRENDLLARWEEWQRSSNNPRYRQLNRAAEQLRDLVEGTGQEKILTDLVIEELLLETYPDRLCRRRRAGADEAKMAGGRGVKLHPDSSVKQSEYFLAIELAEGRDASQALVFQAVGISDALVQQRVSAKALPTLRIEYLEEKFWAIESREWNGLSIGQEHRRPALPEEVKDNLVAVACDRWLQILERNEAMGAWVSRLEFLHERQNKWPLLSPEQIREGLEMACFGENSLARVEAKDLVPYFESLLAEDHLAALQRECPASWVVPSGNRFRIRYTKEQGPQVEVRLQELFGLQKAPLIAQQALTLILLAPNFRPVQVTRDLESFWKNAYPEVRKEMRSRYPKHSWPEDPLTALPQAKGRPRDVLPKEV